MYKLPVGMAAAWSGFEQTANQPHPPTPVSEKIKRQGESIKYICLYWKFYIDQKMYVSNVTKKKSAVRIVCNQANESRNKLL